MITQIELIDSIYDDDIKTDIYFVGNDNKEYKFIYSMFLYLSNTYGFNKVLDILDDIEIMINYGLCELIK